MRCAPVAPRQTPATLAAARTAEADAAAKWAPLAAQEDERARSEAFGLFFGLPGRCEHAARRVRNNITTPPATLRSGRAGRGRDAEGELSDQAAATLGAAPGS